MISLISTYVAGYVYSFPHQGPQICSGARLLYRYAKKTSVSAIFFIGYCVGNIIGPQTFRATDKPRFVPAEVTIIVLFAACVVDMLLLFLYLLWQNKRKERNRVAIRYQYKEGIEFWDLTDRGNLEFVYSL